MSGYSGTRVAPHTRLAICGQAYAVSEAQYRLLRLSLSIGDVILTRRELRSAEILVTLTLGRIATRGSGDGTHVVFHVAEGVTVRP